MAQVELFKKTVTYVDNKDGKTKTSVRFSLKCGNSMIPVEIPYFENKDLNGRDPAYSGRREVLKAFADELPILSDKD
jgi:hypothetical protein